jgi:hypothetical protein
MDVFEMRVPDYFGKARAERIPQNYAMEKSEYIKDRKQVIAEINRKISDLSKQLDRIQDKEDWGYRDIETRLKKCYEIKQNCESSIVLIKEQMKINKR